MSCTAILLTVLCTVFLIASELVVELGVDVSEKCRPVEMHDAVITEGDVTNRFTPIELGASAFFLQSITFVDGPFTRIPAGVPRRVSGSVCFSCMEDRNIYPDIASSCVAKRARTYKPGELEVGVLTTDGAFGTIAEGFRETGGKRDSFEGSGDLTHNGKRYATFILTRIAEKKMLYLEYAHQVHVERLFWLASGSKGSTIWEKTQAPVVTHEISCEVNALGSDHFERALHAYRTIQVENPTSPLAFVDNEQHFAFFSSEDIYRAILSIKVIDDALQNGNFFMYTKCGEYNWTFLAPILTCMAVIILLFAISAYLKSGDIAFGIPYNSRSWFRHARRVDETGEKDLGAQSFRSRYFGSMFDEMVLIEEGNGQTRSQRISLRARRSGQLPEEDGRSGSYLENETPATADTEYNW